MHQESFLDFFAQSKRYFYKTGQVILRPEDPPPGVYYIEKGFVKVYSLTEDGDEKLHIIYKTGEVFPLIWAFSNQSKEVFYEALTETTLRRRSKEEFLKFVKYCCEDNKECEIMLSVIDRLIAMLSVHVDRVENLELTKSYPRLVSRLLFLSKRFGKKDGNKIIINLPLTHKDIASSINMTRETASRELGMMIKKKLIDYRGKKLIILDIKKLEKELSATYHRQLL